MPPDHRSFRHRLKHYLGLICFRTGLYRWFFRKRAVVVLFHRVDDRYAGNPITCTAAAFKTFCDFFAAHFTVISLGELLRRLASGESVGGSLVITLDDGYRDNHEVAAPVLRETKLPACFFVATGFIGSERVPWWDAEQSIPSQWMSWTDVRSLAAQGFEIGSHTVNHVDLGRATGDEARREITESKRRLQEELTVPVDFFTYPYGGPNQISEANRELVRQAGYRCCLSAHGGSVAGTADPLDLPRVPISAWYVSPYQFGLEAMLNRT